MDDAGRSAGVGGGRLIVIVGSKAPKRSRIIGPLDCVAPLTMTPPVAKLPLAEPRNPRYLTEIAQTDGFALTLGQRGLCFAQPLGSLLSLMRNFITILLIAVVARRTAGDG